MKKPGLVIATVIGVVILLWLGFWQKDRLEWKTAYLAEIDAAAEADPLTSMRGVEQALEAGEPLNYRKIALDVAPVTDTPMFRLYRGNAKGGFQWERFVTALAPGYGGYETVLVGYDIVGDAEQTAPDLPPRIYGHVRHYGDTDDLLGGNYSVSDNRYYKFNQDGIWASAANGVPADIWIDADPAIASADAIPDKRPDIPNNHFQYMLTWWSFAVILVIISTILYRREA